MFHCLQKSLHTFLKGALPPATPPVLVLTFVVLLNKVISCHLSENINNRLDYITL